VVEPKKKSQGPGAKAKRLKGLQTNPDFAEAVSEERAAAKMWEDQHDSLHREYMVEMKDQGKWQDKAIANVVLQLDYIEQLKENKELVAENHGLKGIDALMSEALEIQQKDDQRPERINRTLQEGTKSK
jgi:hypothetical protein